MKKKATLKIELKLCDRNRNFNEIIDSIYKTIYERDGVDGLTLVEEFLEDD